MTSSRTVASGTVALVLLVATLPFHGLAPVHAAPAKKTACSAKSSKKKTHCKPAPTPTPSPKSFAAQAMALAGAYRSATSQAERVKAIEGMMAALHVAVYGPSGTPLVPGAGDLSGPFLLEIQIREMVDRLQANATTSLSDLAHDLALIGVHDATGAPLPADMLASALQTGTRAAVAHPHDPTSLAPLLIRELGLHHSPAIDTATSLPAAQIALDPLQRYLLSASILIPWAVSAHRPFRASIAGRQSAMSWLFGGSPIGPSPVQQALGDLLPAGSPPSLSTIKRWFTAQLLKTLHLDIHPVIDEPLETHYGPDAHQGDNGLAGKRITFHLHAGGTDNAISSDADCAKEYALLSTTAICGSQWPLTDMDTNWSYAGIKPYGTLDPNPDGWHEGHLASVLGSEAKLSFVPNNEVVPGMGTEKIAAGVVTASPKVAEKLGVSDPELTATWTVSTRTRHSYGR